MKLICHYPIHMPELGIVLELDAFNYIDRFISNCGMWEANVIAYLTEIVKPGSVCLDVGANAGYQTLIMAALAGESGRVIAFEPNAEILPKLYRNIELNQNLAKHILVKEMGLGAQKEKRCLVQDRGEGKGNAWFTSTGQSSAGQMLEIYTLDELELGPFDVLKLDVEGMELDVLRGGVKSIQQYRPSIVFETLRAKKPEAHKPVEEFLRSLGYNIFALSKGFKSIEQVSYPNYPSEDSLALHPARYTICNR